MNTIHVCYRREDAEKSAQLIVRFLQNRLGRERVVSTADGVAEEVKEGDWLLLVIGPNWAVPAVAEDPLFRQLAATLSQSLKGVLLLVDGAAMPTAGELPVSLHGLLRWQPLELTVEGLESDLEKLVEAMLGPVAQAALKTRRVFLVKAKEVMGHFRRLTRSGPAPEDLPKMGPRGEEDPVQATVGTEPPEQEPEPVLLGAAAPGAVKAGAEFTAHFVAYVREQEAEVRRILAKRSPRSESHLGEEVCRWRHGIQVRVRFRARNLIIDPEEQTFIWVGGRNLLAFDVEVPEDAPEETVVLKFDVLIDDLVVARLRMDLDIRAAADERIRHAPTVEPARTGFASYSSADRSRVLDRVDALTTDSGIHFFMDCLDLHQGEEWKPALAESIRRQELFVLFWSQHSAVSPWVGWELDIAKEQKSRDFIQVQALQPNLPPPTGFEPVHCSSVYMWVREGNEAVQKRSVGN